jgi:hypothetical protein
MGESPVVSGVILANASLDIAFHDTVSIGSCNIGDLLLTSPPLPRKDGTAFFLLILRDGVKKKKIEKNDNSKVSDDEYIKMFWVGLMDGDGSIQVNHWRYQSLQYRLVIKLSNITSNYNMLIKIAKVMGGSVRITGKGKDVIWVVNRKETIKEIIRIFETYPPLTSKKICQLVFLNRCLLENSVDWYLSNRNSKYINQPAILNSDPFGVEINSFALPNYFKGWLSGFIEAEGCFSIRKSNNHSFSIGQNDDFYLMNAIKQFLGTTNIVRNPYRNFYSLEIYKKETLQKIIHHFNGYPLLGEKAESLQKFNQKFKQ